MSLFYTAKATRPSSLFQNTVVHAFYSIDLCGEAIKSHSLSSKFACLVRWIFHLFDSKGKHSTECLPFLMSFSSCEVITNSKGTHFHYKKLKFYSRSPIMPKFQIKVIPIYMVYYVVPLLSIYRESTFYSATRNQTSCYHTHTKPPTNQQKHLQNKTPKSRHKPILYNSPYSNSLIHCSDYKAGTKFLTLNCKEGFLSLKTTLIHDQWTSSHFLLKLSHQFMHKTQSQLS